MNTKQRQEAASIFEKRMGFGFTEEYEQSREWSDAVLLATESMGDRLARMSRAKETCRFTMTDGTRYYGTVTAGNDAGWWLITRGNLIPVETTTDDIAEVVSW